VAILQASEGKIGNENSGEVSIRNRIISESRVKITDAAAQHSCTIDPFSRTIARMQSGDYAISLASSHWEKRFMLLTGSLPDGVTAVFRSTEKSQYAVTLTLTVSENASRGSFNTVLIYEETQSNGMPLRSFCQLNIVVE
jgi:hypothetical protein